MQHRRSSAGRPSGTDGSDFSYRMVVDSSILLSLLPCLFYSATFLVLINERAPHVILIVIVYDLIDLVDVNFWCQGIRK